MICATLALSTLFCEISPAVTVITGPETLPSNAEDEPATNTAAPPKPADSTSNAAAAAPGEAAPPSDNEKLAKLFAKGSEAIQKQGGVQSGNVSSADQNKATSAFSEFGSIFGGN